jgi:hypothetical protein
MVKEKCTFTVNRGLFLIILTIIAFFGKTSLYKKNVKRSFIDTYQKYKYISICLSKNNYMKTVKNKPIVNQHKGIRVKSLKLIT